MSHTIDFYTKKFDEIQSYAASRGLDVPYGDLDEFISDYNDLALSSKNVMKDMKYYLQFETSYKTALAELRALRDIGDTDTRLVDLKKTSMGTFVELRKDEIKATYHAFKKYAGSAKEALKMNSLYWFGSSGE